MVSAAAVDVPGQRLFTGSSDGLVKLWNFASMYPENLAPSREFEPVEGHKVMSIKVDLSGTKLLVCCSDSHARVFDRTGDLLVTTVKGDQYVRVPEHTKGHTHMLGGGEWHPKKPNIFLTYANDCTVRLWDVNAKKIGFDQHIPMQHCLKVTDVRGVVGGKGCMDPLFATAASFSPGDGKLIATGASDGSLQVFCQRVKYGKADKFCRLAHAGGDLTNVTILRDGNSILTRGTDDGGWMRLWDFRKLRNDQKQVECIREWRAPCIQAEADFSLTADERLILAPCQDRNLLLFPITGQDTMTLEIDSIPKKDAHLLKCIYHPVMNQIVVSSSCGGIAMLYDPIKSVGGATNFPKKAYVKESTVQYFGNAEALTFDELRKKFGRKYVERL